MLLGDGDLMADSCISNRPVLPAGILLCGFLALAGCSDVYKRKEIIITGYYKEYPSSKSNIYLYFMTNSFFFLISW